MRRVIASGLARSGSHTGGRPPAVCLACGEWLRWHVNWRFAGTHSDAMAYRLDTLNLAYGTVLGVTSLGATANHISDPPSRADPSTLPPS
jgi:hypothetical protein